MFKCGKCGLCCRHIDKSGIEVGLDRGDGVCKYYAENTRLCSIYENRPLICNVDAAYKRWFKDKMSLDEYYKLNYDSCKELRELYEED